MDRRGVIAGLAGGAVSAAAGVGRTLAQDRPVKALAELRALGAEAYTYVLPLFEVASQRLRAQGLGLKPNTYLHRRELATPERREVTTPNLDTLYSSVFLDLSAPVAMTLPPTGGRYFSLALMDAWSNNFAVLHDEAAGRRSDAVVSYGPSQRLIPPLDAADMPHRPALPLAPTRHVWALARTYAGPDTLAQARRVQDQLKIRTLGELRPESAAPASPMPRRDDVEAVLSLCNTLMVEDAPLPGDGPLLKRLARIGVGPGLAFGQGLSPAEKQAVLEGARAALADLKAAKASKVVNGWRTPPADLGDFGTDYRVRAETAISGLAALPNREAMYFTTDAVLDGTAARRLRFAKGELPPVDAFWSVTLYEQALEGGLYLFDNPAKRYAIGSNSPDLRYAGRGLNQSLDVIVAPDPPVSALFRNNWLPCPRGPYKLVLRLYRPRPAALEGRWRLPTLS